jgi:hypothetical protein
MPVEGRFATASFPNPGALAWLLATCPKDSHRNGKLAIIYATQACKLTHWQVPSCLVVLAAAYAENRQFQEAVKWQKKALEFPGYDKEGKEDLLKRLKLYERGESYRDEQQ